LLIVSVTEALTVANPKRLARAYSGLRLPVCL
jgi:hypothetical protein